MKEAANRGGLDKMNTYPLSVAPSDLAFPFDEFWLDQECEVIGDACLALDLKGRAGLRHIANNTVDSNGDAEGDQPSLQGTQPRRLALFVGHRWILECGQTTFGEHAHLRADNTRRKLRNSQNL